MSENNNRIFVDMDGVLAKWQNVAFEDLFEKDYFKSLPPQGRVVYTVKELVKNNADVYVLSCYLHDSKYALAEKNAWLDEFIPELPKNKRIFVPFGESKAEYFNTLGLMPITKTDLLIDDYTKNLLEWSELGGTGVKLLNGINHTHGTWQEAKVDMKTITAETILKIASNIGIEESRGKEMSELNDKTCLYMLSYEKDSIFQVCLVETSMTPQQTKTYFEHTHNPGKINICRPATSDDLKPGIPCIKIQNEVRFVRSSNPRVKNFLNLRGYLIPNSNHGYDFRLPDGSQFSTSAVIKSSILGKLEDRKIDFSFRTANGNTYVFDNIDPILLEPKRQSLPIGSNEKTLAEKLAEAKKQADERNRQMPQQSYHSERSNYGRKSTGR